jgi:hypothetical protein
MNERKYLHGLLLLLLLTGCGDALTFDVTANVDEFTVPGDPHLHHGGAPIDRAEIPPVELQMPGIQAGAFTLTDLRFFVTNSSMDEQTADDDDLSFLTQLEVYVVPTSRNSVLPPLRVAQWEGPAPYGETTIELQIDAEYDLLPYITEGAELTIHTEGIVPYDDVSIRGEAIFAVIPF